MDIPLLLSPEFERPSGNKSTPSGTLPKDGKEYPPSTGCAASIPTLDLTPLARGPLLPSLPRDESPAQSYHLAPQVSSTTRKRKAPSKPDESHARKWTPEEDNLIIELRQAKTKWSDMPQRLPDRSALACRLRYQNYLEKRQVWDEEKKDKLSMLYNRYCLFAYTYLSFPHFS